MIGSSVPTYPIKKYRCCICDRNLGDSLSRLKGKKQPCVNIINGKCYCNKCAEEFWEK